MPYHSVFIIVLLLCGLPVYAQQCLVCDAVTRVPIREVEVRADGKLVGKTTYRGLISRRHQPYFYILIVLFFYIFASWSAANLTVLLNTYTFSENDTAYFLRRQGGCACARDSPAQA